MYDIFYYNILQYVIVFVQNDRNGADQREIGLSDFY